MRRARLCIHTPEEETSNDTEKAVGSRLPHVGQITVDAAPSNVPVILSPPGGL